MIPLDKISISIFWKFWKPPNFYSSSSHQNFWQIHGPVNRYVWELSQRNHHDSNNGSYKHEMPIKPLDDASSICETWYNWRFLEFLMKILTNFCDGPLSITCGTTKSCSNVTTEFYTCQKFGSEIDQGLEISYIFTHYQFVFTSGNIEHPWRRCQRCSVKSVKSLIRT